MPEDRSIVEVRRHVDAIVAVIGLHRTSRACGSDILKALLRAPKMRGLRVAANWAKPINLEAVQLASGEVDLGVNELPWLDVAVVRRDRTVVCVVSMVFSG